MFNIDQICENLIRLDMGDVYEEGHKQSDVTYILCNVDNKSMRDAYRRGTRCVQFDLEDHYKYRGNKTLPLDEFEKFKELGFEVLPQFIEENEDHIILNNQAYILLWLFIARKGYEKLYFRFLQYHEEINIGGYSVYDAETESESEADSDDAEELRQLELDTRKKREMLAKEEEKKKYENKSKSKSKSKNKKKNSDSDDDEVINVI